MLLSHNAASTAMPEERSMYLSRMIYYSKNAIPPGQQSAYTEIKQILNKSVENNKLINVSGALLFNQNYFAQVLEGDRKAITETFCRISQDKRHSDIVILETKPVNERIFLDWSMAFAGHSDVADDLYRRFSTHSKFEPSKMTADALLGFVCELVKCDEHIAKSKDAKKKLAAA